MDKMKFTPANNTGCYLCLTESEKGESVIMYLEIDRNEIGKMRKIAADNSVDHVSVLNDNVWFRFGWLDEETLKNFQEVEQVDFADDVDDEWECVNNTLSVGPTWWQVEIRYPDYVLANSAAQDIDW